MYEPKIKESEKMAGKKRIYIVFDIRGKELEISLKDLEKRLKRSRNTNPDGEFYIRIINRQ